MNLTIDGFSSYGKNQILKRRNNLKKSENSNVSFQGINYNKVTHYAGYMLGTAVFATLLACTNSNTQKTNENDTTTTIIYNTDSDIVENNNVRRAIYHYLPSDKEMSSEDYTWKETVNPDGSVEKDSMGYKININPEGQRTVSKTVKNSNGNNVITTSYPDGSKEVRIENGINYNDTTFWANGNIKTIKIKDVEIEHGDSPTDDKELIKNQTYKVYDENGVLLYWEVFDSSLKNNEKNYKYDNLGRIIDDGFAKYEYEGNSDKPSRITEELEGCKYITEYDSIGIKEKKQYFEASNGVITPYSQIYETNW